MEDLTIDNAIILLYDYNSKVHLILVIQGNCTDQYVAYYLLDAAMHYVTLEYNLMSKVVLILFGEHGIESMPYYSEFNRLEAAALLFKDGCKHLEATEYLESIVKNRQYEQLNFTVLIRELSRYCTKNNKNDESLV